MVRKRSSASGRIAYQIHVPRRSAVSQPASRNTRRWCDIVGWLTAQHSPRSQAQHVPVVASCRMMRMRLGSAMAARSALSGSSLVFTAGYYQPVLTNVDIDEYQYSVQIRRGGASWFDRIVATATTVAATAAAAADTSRELVTWAAGRARLCRPFACYDAKA